MDEVLFWLHIVVVLAAMSLGFLMPLGVVVFIVVVHRVHVLVFGDCLLSIAQRLNGGLASEQCFLQMACQRFFNLNISERGAKILDYTIVLIPILIAAVS